MESEKRHITLNLGNGKSVQAVERDCGDYVEITPRGTFFDVDGCTMVQGVPLPAKGDDSNSFRLSFPVVVYKIPKNLPQLDRAEQKKVITQIWFEKVQKLVSYCIIGLNESVTRDGNPDLVMDHDAIMKILEERKTRLDLDDDVVDKLCEEIKMKLKM